MPNRAEMTKAIRIVGLFFSMLILFAVALLGSWSVGLALAGIALTLVFFFAWLIDYLSEKAQLRDVKRRFVKLDEYAAELSAESRKLSTEATTNTSVAPEPPALADPHKTGFSRSPSTFRGAVWGGVAGGIAFALFSPALPSEFQTIYAFLFCVIPGALLGAWGLRH